MLQYNVIIVDDEQAILNSMVKIIKWEELGLKVVALCKDGCEAISFIKSNDVDIVLTDIKMPNMDGIELARQIDEYDKRIKTILISGVQDFEMARNAIKYNVSQYLLKPTRHGELVSALKQAKVELDQEARQISEELKPLFKKQMFFDLSTGALLDKKKIKNNFERLNINTDCILRRCAVANFRILNFNKYIETLWNYGYERMCTAISSFFAETENDDLTYDVFNQTEDKFSVFVLMKNKLDNEGFETHLGEHFNKVKQNIAEVLSMEIQQINIRVYENVLQVPKKLMTLDPEISINKEKEHIELLVYYMNLGDVNAVNNLISNYYSVLVSKSDDEIKAFNEQLYWKIQKDLQIKSESFREEVALFNKGENFSEVFSNVKAALISMTSFVEANLPNCVNTTAAKVKAYVEENYSKDISLESVSRHLFLSPTYISKIFKEQTGENFIDYVINFRIEKAKDLLKNTDAKVYEIADKVGYKGIKYFYKIFKRNTGLSPTAYRQKYLR
jgi:two-component system response regulator YesN